MALQKLLVIETDGRSTRSSIYRFVLVDDPETIWRELGVMIDDGKENVDIVDVSIEDVHEAKISKQYPTVLHAMADGWKLLGSPIETSHHFVGTTKTTYEWWLVREYG